MIVDELAYQIRRTFGLTPTVEQVGAIDVFCRFMTDRDTRSVMIMRGSAGTGKTTLAAAMVKTMISLNRNVMLLAPTGRAAKVFSLNAGHAAFTIHRKIYRQKTFNGDIGSFELGDNKFRDMLFMVDEASMIANEGMSDMAFFGTGRLLDDLLSFVYKGHNCRLLLVGDKAQLPPVGEEESPALMPNVLEGYGLKVYSCDLNEVLRQSIDSGILYNATVIRQMITHDEITRLPKITFDGFADIKIVNGNELIEQLNSSYYEVGIDETIVITRSNKRANVYNAGIRNMVLGREENISTGDMLMVVRNNYYWVEEKEKPDTENKESEDSSMTFIANGDRACVQKVTNVRELYGFHFADVYLTFPDYDEQEIKATVIMDSLTAEAPALTRQQGETLFNAISEDYADIPTKAERMKKIRQDPYFNAIQIKYAYAVTCHKAQGGQWAHIYLDQGYMTDDMLSPDYIHWLYTAFTRATERLFLVNWPKTQIKGIAKSTEN
ncbi:MAG: AAA family ATPase [Prevotella sp.]|nr:AAA family ATPase [Prevotella sp.]